jgi:hypothetical protein
MDPKTFTIGRRRRVFRVGDQVECEVSWPDGRKTTNRGELVWIDEDKGEVYINQTGVGALAGDLSTLEHV